MFIFIYFAGMFFSFIAGSGIGAIMQKDLMLKMLKARNLVKHREADGVLIWRDDETEVKL